MNYEREVARLLDFQRGQDEPRQDFADRVYCRFDEAYKLLSSVKGFQRTTPEWMRARENFKEELWRYRELLDRGPIIAWSAL